MLLLVDRQAGAHVAVALHRHMQDCRRDGLVLPAEVRALADRLVQWVTAGQDGPQVDAAHLVAEGEGRMDPLLLTLDEVAGKLSCSSSTVKRLIATTQLPAVSFAGGRRVRVADLEDFVAGLPSASGIRDDAQPASDPLDQRDRRPSPPDPNAVIAGSH